MDRNDMRRIDVSPWVIVFVVVFACLIIGLILIALPILIGGGK